MPSIFRAYLFKSICEAEKDRAESVITKEGSYHHGLTLSQFADGGDGRHVRGWL
jgi:hypothetical protein